MALPTGKPRLSSLVLMLMLQLVVLWALVIALYLASVGEQEHRVVFNNQTEDSLTSCMCADQNITANATCDFHQFEADNCSTVCPGAICQFVKYTKNKDYSLLSFVNLFGLYWGVFFFGAFGELVLAGVFSQWYWTLDKSKDLPSFALGTAIWNATVFHLGTVAFGSLVIAIIRMIRTILEYVEKKLKMFNNDLTK